MSAPDTAEVLWRPQPGPQTALLSCPVFEVLYGGARGGGKTDGMLGEFAGHAHRYGENANGLMVRRERTELIDTIERSKRLYGMLGWKFNDTDKLWRSPDGARLRFAYLENDADAEGYQGHSYSRIYAEEIGNFPSPKPIMKLMATLRSAHGVPVGFRATGNPGGPGHQWVKARYIDPNPMGFEIINSAFKNPFTGETFTRERVFIPARVSDNKFLGADYVANIQMSGTPKLVQAWLDGDWSVIEGAFFPEFSIAQHVVAPRWLPEEWTRVRAADWGSAKPFSVGWYAISDGQVPEFPRGALVKYREWYGIRTQPDGSYEPDVGVKLTAEEVAKGIVELEAGDRINLAHSVMDPSAFAESGGPSIGERMWRAGAKFMKADNSRVAKRGALGGWDQLRARLVGTASRDKETGAIDWSTGRPMLYFFSTCAHTIRTLPALQNDDAKPEDLDTHSEDHCGDETRYICMARPYVRDGEARPLTEAQAIAVMIAKRPTLDELWAKHEAGLRQEARI